MDTNNAVHLGRFIEDSDWKFTTFQIETPTTVERFAAVQSNILRECEHTILEFGSLFNISSFKFKILTDCHGDSRTYSVIELVFMDDGVFKRETSFLHTDEDSTSIGGSHFDGIDLKEINEYSLQKNV
jgi:hypothetical protein